MNIQRKQIIALVGILISATFLYFSIRNLDGEKLFSILKNAELVYFIPYTFLTLLFFLLKAIRWKELLVDVKSFKINYLFGPIMIGFGFNNIFPFRAGELIRMVVFSKHSGLSNYTVMSSMGLERLFDILGLCSLGILMIILNDSNIERVRTEMLFLAIAVFLSLIVGIYILRNKKKTNYVLDKILVPLPEKYLNYIRTKADLFVFGLSSLKKTKLLIRSSINSFIQWLLMVGCVMLSAKSISIDIPLTAAALTMIVSAFGVALPNAPAYVGTIELSFVLVLGWYGIPTEVAFASAVIYHFFNFIIVTTLGVYYAYRMGFRLNSTLSSISNPNDVV